MKRTPRLPDWVVRLGELFDRQPDRVRSTCTRIAGLAAVAALSLGIGVASSAFPLIAVGPLLGTAVVIAALASVVAWLAARSASQHGADPDSPA